MAEFGYLLRRAAHYPLSSDWGFCVLWYNLCMNKITCYLHKDAWDELVNGTVGLKGDHGKYRKKKGELPECLRDTLWFRLVDKKRYPNSNPANYVRLELSENPRSI